MNIERCLPAILILFAAMTTATDVRAVDGVIGPGECDEARFGNVLDTVDSSGGGTITFDCGNAPVTIGFTGYKSIANTVTIDGANRIIFDGGGMSAFLQIFASANVTLKRLTFQHGAFNASHAIENNGVLVLESVKVIDNVSASSAIANFGHLTIRSSTLSRNAIDSSMASGVALFTDGTAIIEQSIFSDNAFNGGAGSNGGAIVLNGDLGGTLAVSNTVFRNNAARNGGAISVESGQLTVVNSEFVENSAAFAGGAIDCSSGTINVRSSAFADNLAGTNGAGIFSHCALTAINLTLSGNSASAGGGGLYQDSNSDSSVIFATFRGNSAAFGGGVYNEFNNISDLRIANSIISENTGSNCDGAILSSGYNLSSGGAECAFSNSAPGDLFAESLPLRPYALYGGPTSTQPPLAGNAAIDHVPVAACGSPGNRVDQRGATRPVGPACDSGAVEFGGVFDRIFSDGFE